MRDNFLRDVKVSQFGLFVWCANLTAFFCTLSNTLICPSLYGSHHAAPYSRIGRTSDKLPILQKKKLLTCEVLIFTRNLFNFSLIVVSVSDTLLKFVYLLSTCHSSANITMPSEDAISHLFSPFPYFHQYSSLPKSQDFVVFHILSSFWKPLALPKHTSC